jgi:hypothetical protein
MLVDSRHFDRPTHFQLKPNCSPSALFGKLSRTLLIPFRKQEDDPTGTDGLESMRMTVLE